MILVVNLNLAVDEIVHLDGLKVGEVQRTENVERLAGGKGVNVARVLKVFSEQATLAGFLGGRAGRFIAGELQREGITFDCAWIRGESRTCIILDDTALHTQTVINETGPEIHEDELREFTSLYARLLKDAAAVVITGSLPGKLRPEIYARLIALACEAGKPVLLDSSSEALRAAISARPFLVKINGEEARELLGTSVKDFDEAAQALSQLKALGAAHAMITLGARGAVLDFESVVYRIKAPGVAARNSVGSGDAVMAGLATALVRGLGPEEMARLAVAAGAANALYGAGRCRAEDIQRLSSGVELC